MNFLARLGRITYLNLIGPRLLMFSCLSLLTHFLYCLLNRKPDHDGQQDAPIKKNVLMVARNPLALTYALAMVDHFAKNNNISFFLTGPFRLRREMIKISPSRTNVVGVVSLFSAILNRWNLICFPSHFCAGLFHPSIPKIFTAHGLETGRRIYGGTGYTYSWKALSGIKTCPYDGFLATSFSEFSMASSDANGHLFVDKIILGSEPVALKLLRRVSSVSHEADRNISQPKEVLVFIMSTWGSESLLARYGAELLEKIRSLPKEIRAVLSVHPRNYQVRSLSVLVENFRSAGVEVIPPQPDSWIPFMLSANIAIADKTSLSLYFSLLGKPMIFLPIDAAEFLAGSPLVALSRLCPTLDLSKDLAQQITNCLASDNAGAVNNFSRETFPHIGDAAKFEADICRFMSPCQPQGSS